MALFSSKSVRNTRWHLANSRRIVWIYAVTFVLLAGLLLVAHSISDSIIDQQGSNARTIELSTHQGMLSQRVARLAQKLVMTPGREPDEDVVAGISQDLQEMQKAELALTDRSNTEGIAPPTSAALHQIYFDRPYMLHREVADYVKHAHSLVAAPVAERTPANADFIAIQKAADGSLQNALNAAIEEYRTENNAMVRRLHHLLHTIIFLLFGVLLVEALVVFRPLFRKLAQTHGSLLHAALTDPLTGCLNRRAFTEEANREFARTLRFGSTFSLIVLDIDNFKEINDANGHAAGDHAIVALVGALLSHLRQTEILGRMGGDEFAILLPQTQVEKAALAAERLRQAVAGSRVRAGQKNFSVTVSMGVSMCHPGDTGLFDAYNRADRALYSAKQSGRNTISVDKSDELATS